MVGIVLVYHGSQVALAAVTAAIAGANRIGLYQNDWEPQPNQNIAAVVPATFSGYAGLLALTSWTVPVMVGDQAVSQADQVVWTHSGGPVSNWIYGIYVVDGSGALLWAERVWDPPVPLFAGGQFASYVPYLTQESKFTGR